MLTVLMTSIAVGAAVTFLVWTRHTCTDHKGGGGLHAIAGATALALGLATSLPVTAHLLNTLAKEWTAPHLLNLEEACLLILALTIWLPGLFCLAQVRGLQKGELQAQTRTIAAAAVLFGLTLPLAVSEPLAVLMSALSLASILVLLVSRTNAEITELAESTRYSPAIRSELRLEQHRWLAGLTRADS